MSIARALTKRPRRSHSNAAPARDGSIKYAPGTIKRELISLPTELISTTNVNALNAPDIASLRSASSTSSINSGNESDFSRISKNFLDSPATTPGTTSPESSPIPSDSGNTTFFNNVKRPATAGRGRTISNISDSEPPAIPERALSHSKKAHQEFARKRSVSRMSPPPTSLSGAATLGNSAGLFSRTADPDHPFGRELAQVNEVAEEFGLVSASLDAEERELLTRGLKKFSVQDYLDEIQGFYGGVFEGRLGPRANPWP